MKQLIRILAFFLILVSCGEPEKESNTELLSEEALMDLLYDTYLYEGALKAHALDSVYKEKSVLEFYDAILKKHQIEREIAVESLTSYAKQKKLIPLLDKVKERIKARKEYLEKEKTKQ